MPKAAKKKRVWVVMHYEITHDYSADCLQFHVSSSLRKAEQYITRYWMVPWSWWQIYPYVIDHDDCLGDEGEEVCYYSHTGKCLKVAQFTEAQQACIRAYKRQKKAGAKGSW